MLAQNLGLPKEALAWIKFSASIIQKSKRSTRASSSIAVSKSSATKEQEAQSTERRDASVADDATTQHSPTAPVLSSISGATKNPF